MACVTLKRSLDHDATSATSTKRRRFHCGVGSRSPSSPNSAHSSASTSSSALTFVPPPAEPLANAASALTDFPASRLPPELLSQRLTAEVRRLQRRRQLMTPPTGASGGCVVAAQTAATDADMQLTAVACCAHCGSVKPASCSASQSPSSDPPLFTMSQVQSIAEKLLADREQQIRNEFQALLSAKLQEQYDAFLRFNHDQIYRMHSGAPMSYVS